MSDRRLVVTELDPADPHYGEVFALATNNATAVPVPAFRFGNAKPPVGSALGEAFYETTSHKGWVWDGAAWREIAATPLKTYPTEAALQADVSQLTGTYAIATDTGSLFIKQGTGWAFVGIRDYTSTANLLADPAPTGQLGLALDDDTLWQRTPNGWRAMSIRHLADTAAVQAWANPPGTPAGTNPQGVTRGDQAVDLLHEVMYARTATGWKPETIWEDTEANIRAATWCLVGQEAIATDTGRTFVYTTSGWIEEPIRHYATQAALLADTPVSNTFAWAEDTGNMFTYVQAKGWIGMNSSMDDPVPIGALLDFPSRAIPNGWLECNGQTIPADAKYNDLRTILGTTTVPDLRGYFNRASKAGETVLSKHQWTTGMPRTAFTATTNTAGTHHHVAASQGEDLGGGSGNIVLTTSGGQGGWAHNTSDDGAHSHTVTISGGDSETAPDHVIVVRCIKAFHITATVPGPDRLLTAIATPTDRQVLIYDAATSSWKNGDLAIPTVGATDDGKILAAVSGSPAWATPSVKVSNHVSSMTIDGRGEYLLEGGVYLDVAEWIYLNFYAPDGTTLHAIDPATWKLQGHAFKHLQTQASLTATDTDSDTHGSRGWMLSDNNHRLHLGQHWWQRLSWHHLRVQVITTDANTRSAQPFICMSGDYIDDQDRATSFNLRMTPPSGTEIGQVRVGCTQTFYTSLSLKVFR